MKAGYELGVNWATPREKGGREVEERKFARLSSVRLACAMATSPHHRAGIVPPPRAPFSHSFRPAVQSSGPSSGPPQNQLTPGGRR